LQIVRIPRGKLNQAGLLPDCSPFSNAWMSALDNARSKAELGMKYTPLTSYLGNIVESLEAKHRMAVKGYSRRALELELSGTESPEW
jgi:hypothetical protein